MTMKNVELKTLEHEMRFVLMTLKKEDEKLEREYQYENGDLYVKVTNRWSNEEGEHGSENYKIWMEDFQTAVFNDLLEGYSVESIEDFDLPDEC